MNQSKHTVNTCSSRQQRKSAREKSQLVLTLNFF